MTIVVNAESILNNVKGERTHGNCKPVVCINTGDVYASTLDAAKAIGCSDSYVSVACRYGYNIKGKRYCYLADFNEHMDEFMQNMRNKRNEINPSLEKSNELLVKRVQQLETENGQLREDNNRLISEKEKAKEMLDKMSALLA